MVPVSPSSNFVGSSQFVGPEMGLLGGAGPAAGATVSVVPQHAGLLPYPQQDNSSIPHGHSAVTATHTAGMHHPQQQQQQWTHYQHPGATGSGSSPYFRITGLQQQQAVLPHQQLPTAPTAQPACQHWLLLVLLVLRAAWAQPDRRVPRNSSSMHRAHSCATLRRH